MNTREVITPIFQESPSIGNLFYTIWRVCSEWIQARMYARALRKLEFRQLRENEMTDEMRRKLENARTVSDEELINI